MTIFDANQK
jgi:hypothetical protein